MRKIVFLFVMSCFMSVSSTAADSWEYEEDDYKIILTSSRNDDGYIEYNIRKIGSNPFVLDWSIDEHHVYFKGVKEVDGNHVLYGSIKEKSLDPEIYDVYILVLSKKGEVLHEFSYDCGHDDHVLNVYDFNGMINIETWSNDEFADRQTSFFMELRRFDYEYNFIDYVRVDEYYIYSYVNNGYFFFGNNENHNYVLIDKDLSVFEDNDHLDMDSGTVYSDTVRIPTVNEAILNGEAISAGIEINYPGIYELEYNDYLYKFTVEPTLGGIEDGVVYDAPVTPLFKSGNAMLNGSAFVSGTVIDQPGSYTLSIEGIGGYQKSVSFLISSNIDGVFNNQTYTEDLEINFSGIGYLNNVHMTSPINISEPGEYILKIQGENDYLESYYFQIEEPESGNSMIDIVQKYDFVLFGIVLVVSIFVLRKKK